MNIMHLVNALPGVVAQGLIWGIMAIGVYITYRILDVADLTVDGTMATGGATFIMLTMAGVPLPLALLGAFLAGVLAGLVTGLFHTVCGIPAILAGILTQLALYSVNLRVMGQANRPVSSRQYELLVDQQSVRSLSLDNPILVVAVFVAAQFLNINLALIIVICGLGGAGAYLIGRRMHKEDKGGSAK